MHKLILITYLLRHCLKKINKKMIKISVPTVNRYPPLSFSIFKQHFVPIFPNSKNTSNLSENLT